MNPFGLWRPDERLLLWGLSSLLQMTLASAGALLIAALLRRHPAARHGILCAGLALVAISPIAAGVMQGMGVGLTPVALVNRSSAGQRAAPPGGENGALATGGNRNGASVDAQAFLDQRARAGAKIATPANSIARRDDVARSDLPRGEQASAARIPAAPARMAGAAETRIGRLIRAIIPPLLAVWLVGAAALLVRLAIGWSRMAAILRAARKNTDATLAASFAAVAGSRVAELVISDRLAGPVAAGLWRPRVLFPAALVGRLTADEARHILRHEAAHLLRRDQLVVLLQNLVAALCWIHPLTRPLNRQLSQAREEVCDNYVLASADVLAYSRTLLRVAELIQDARPQLGSVGFFAARWRLDRRVADLLDERRNRATRLTAKDRMRVVAASLALAGVASLGAVRSAVGQAPDGAATTDRSPDPKAETQPPVNKSAPVGKSAPAQERRNPAVPIEERTTMIKGRIADEKGKPVAGAFVAVIGGKPGNNGTTKGALAEGTADSTGAYELALAGANYSDYFEPNVVARAEGMAMAWRRVELVEGELRVDLTLRSQQSIRIRLVDEKGAAAAKVALELTVILSKEPPAPVPAECATAMRFWRLTPPLRNVLPTLISDDDGMLTIPGIPPEAGVCVDLVGSEQFAPQHLELNTGRPEERPEHDGTYRGLVRNVAPGETATIRLAPARMFQGRVLLGDGDMPAAEAQIDIWASEQRFGSMILVRGKTDAAGRFRSNPYAGERFGINAYPPKGTSFLPRELRELEWTPDGSRNIEIRLPTGVLARGTIVDEASGKPLAGASVQYRKGANNKFSPEDIVTEWQAMRLTDELGQFAIVVPPGPGSLLFHAPLGENYILQEMGSRELDRGQPGGWRYYAHAFRKIDFPTPTAMVAAPSLGILEFAPITMRAGGVATAKLVDSTGKPLEDAIFTSRLEIHPNSPDWRGTSKPAPNGIAQIRGLEPGKPCPVYFLEPNRRLGATAMISTDDPRPTIELQPCASAKARFLRPDGKPVKPGSRHGLQMVVTPGSSKYDRDHPERLAADEDFVENIDKVNYRGDRGADDQGVIFWPVLIPGATYRFLDFDDAGHSIPEKEFVAESGKLHDLGDITLLTKD